jgi:hypothetical protein
VVADGPDGFVQMGGECGWEGLAILEVLEHAELNGMHGGADGAKTDRYNRDSGILFSHAQ